jgi:hypothetical protein
LTGISFGVEHSRALVRWFVGDFRPGVEGVEEGKDVRYVHVMEHLRVGCVCAGHMEEDLVGARAREDAFKASRSRRARWLTRQWRQSWKSNQYLNADGFNVVVYPVGDSFGARIEHRETGRRRVSKRLYATEERAKLAAFDAMIAELRDGSHDLQRGANKATSFLSSCAERPRSGAATVALKLWDRRAFSAKWR